MLFTIEVLFLISKKTTHDFKGEKRILCPRKLPNPLPLLQEIMVHPLLRSCPREGVFKRGSKRWPKEAVSEQTDYVLLFFLFFQTASISSFWSSKGGAVLSWHENKFLSIYKWSDDSATEKRDPLAWAWERPILQVGKLLCSISHLLVTSSLCFKRVFVRKSEYDCHKNEHVGWYISVWVVSY